MLQEATPTCRWTGSILNVPSMKLELLCPEGKVDLFSWPDVSCGGAQERHSWSLLFYRCNELCWIIPAGNPCWGWKMGGVWMDQNQNSRTRRHPDLLCTLKLNTCKTGKELVCNWSRCSHLSVSWTSAFSINHMLFTTQTSTHSTKAN